LRQRQTSRSQKSGFTLIEVAVAIVVVGLGVTALMQLTAACSMQNRASADLTTSAMLAQHVQEILADLPISDPVVGAASFGREAGETMDSYDDIDDFDGLTFEPIDSTRSALAGFDDYQQRVTVYPVSGKQLNGNQNGAAIPKTTYTGAVRVRVEILRTDPVTNLAASVYQLDWVRVED
jgi:prepilin-type N-terminal cleavage/methylation domain-containing protein